MFGVGLASLPCPTPVSEALFGDLTMCTLIGIVLTKKSTYAMLFFDCCLEYRNPLKSFNILKHFHHFGAYCTLKSKKQNWNNSLH